MTPALRKKNYPIGPRLDSHMKSACSATGACGLKPALGVGKKIKGPIHSHATWEELKARQKKW